MTSPNATKLGSGSTRGCSLAAPLALLFIFRLDDSRAASRKPHRQRFEPPQDERRPVAQGLSGNGQTEVRRPSQQRVDGDLALESRQRGAEQKCTPCPNDKCRLGSRSSCSSSGWSNWRLSRLADPITANTISPRGIVTPANVTSSSA